ALARAVDLERALRADSVRALEDPVLPRREAAEDLALERLGPAEPNRRLHTGERVGRERRALLERDADLVVPVDVVRCERDEPGLRRGGGVQIFAETRAELVRSAGLGQESARQPREAVDHRIGAEVRLGEPDRGGRTRVDGLTRLA